MKGVSCSSGGTAEIHVGIRTGLVEIGDGRFEKGDAADGRADSDQWHGIRSYNLTAPA